MSLIAQPPYPKKNTAEPAGPPLKLRDARDQALAKLKSLAQDKTYLFHEPVATVARRKRVVLDRFVFAGPETSSEPVRLAFFGSLLPEDPYSLLALAEFVEDLYASPDLATGTHLYLYPATHAADGDLRRPLHEDLWRDSEEAEPYLVERELGVIGFHGVVSLLVQKKLSGFHAQIFGPAGSLYRPLVEKTAERVNHLLPLAASGDWLAAQRLSLLSGSGLKPSPFEVALKVPFEVTASLAINGLRLALHSILSEYRAAISHANHI
jgi:hypothetical protein